MNESTGTQQMKTQTRLANCPALSKRKLYFAVSCFRSMTKD